MIWYNTNIRSLSTFSMDPQIYFEWHYDKPKIKIYCGCKNCRSLPDFNPEHEKIFFKLRAKEVQRLVNGINKFSSHRLNVEFLHPDPNQDIEKTLLEKITSHKNKMLILLNPLKETHKPLVDAIDNLMKVIDNYIFPSKDKKIEFVELEFKQKTKIVFDSGRTLCYQEWQKIQELLN